MMTPRSFAQHARALFAIAAAYGRSLWRPGFAVLACLAVGGHSRPSSSVTVADAFRFDGMAGGGLPGGGLLSSGGYLYGTLLSGGANKDGVVYSLHKPHGGAWQETVLWSFTGAADGAGPTGTLIQDTNGALYGVTGGGGTYASGTVFVLTPPGSGQTAWTETTLYTFSHGEDGGVPIGGLIADAQGNFYGTTARYGANGFGTVFKLSPPGQGKTAWTYTTLWSFTGNGDGGSPVASLIMDTAGNLYGTAARGGLTNIGGTVFELSPSAGGVYTETTLHQFSGPDGTYPTAPLIADQAGNLYSTAAFGGTFGQGVAFELSPPSQQGGAWTEQTIWNFSTASGLRYPFSGLLANKAGILYGATFGYATDTYPVTPSAIFTLEPPVQSGQPWTEATIAVVNSRAGYDVALPLAVGPGDLLVVPAQYLGPDVDTGGRHLTGAIMEVENSGF